jgi:hypothetical protein
MVRLQAHENTGGYDAVVTADGAVVGKITMTGKNRFSVDTGGRIPAIDGLAGTSPRDAWSKVVQQIQAGGVVYHAPVKIGP